MTTYVHHSRQDDGTHSIDVEGSLEEAFLTLSLSEADHIAYVHQAHRVMGVLMLCGFFGTVFGFLLGRLL